MASALGNLMANYTDSEGEEAGEGGSEGEGDVSRNSEKMKS